MKSDQAITVTAAIIMDSERVLVAQRPPGGRHPGEWEFPGGKIEPGETLHQCLARELKEELDVTVRVGRKLAIVRHCYPDLEVELVAFECDITDGDLTDIECSAHEWVEPAMLGEYSLLPPDEVLARELFGV